MRSVLAASALVAGALGQQGVWQQCGGANWDGPTTCVAGSHCQVNNEWYWQCVPGSGPPPSTTLRTSTTQGEPGPTSTDDTPEPTPTDDGPGPGPGPGDSEFPYADGTMFNIDGETKYFAGTNCYWCSFLENPADVDLALGHLAEAGHKILRVWGFNDVNTVPEWEQPYFQLLTPEGSTINTGENGLQRLDYVVEAAERLGLTLIINFVNNWDDYGGIKAYTNVFGGTHQEWYTNEAAQTQYRKYIDAVVARYKSSPAILAWELANEPRCAGCDTDVIYNWAKSTSEYVKSLDPDHMVTLGDEGMGIPGDSSYPYGYSEGTDFIKNLEIETLDFGVFHMYPDHWGVSFEWGNMWIEDHAAACVAAGKPCVLEEYGAIDEHCERERPWQITSVASEGMAADLFWQFGDTISTGKAHDDGFTIYYGDADWECLVDDHVEAIG